MEDDATPISESVPVPSPPSGSSEKEATENEESGIDEHSWFSFHS